MQGWVGACKATKWGRVMEHWLLLLWTDTLPPTPPPPHTHARVYDCFALLWGFTFDSHFNVKLYEDKCSYRTAIQSAYTMLMSALIYALSLFTCVELPDANINHKLLLLGHTNGSSAKRWWQRWDRWLLVLVIDMSTKEMDHWFSQQCWQLCIV